MLASKTGLPRLTPLTIHRARLERWLHAYAQTPVRLIIAPSGSGKSTLLLTYVSQSETLTAYCALPAGCGPVSLRESLASALALPKVPKTYTHLVDAISAKATPSLEIAIDDIDNAADETLDELLRLVEDVGENVTFLYAGRSRERMQARRLIARGLGELCDARRLGFDAEEAALFAQACGAACTDLEINRLVDDTDGWAIALCSTIRTAAAEGETIARAYERWRKQSSAFLHELVAVELDRVSESDRTLFWNVLAGRSKGDMMQLRHLEGCGLFVYDDGQDLRPYRALLAAPAKTVAVVTHGEAPSMSPMVVHMFRCFEAKIGGRDIPWVRKRDQQIVKYLLLKPDGKATRTELAQIFWSDTDRHLAAQSVRTACSNIRKAFASIVGYAAVDSYFRTVPDVQIDLSLVVCDARRFSAHVSDAESCFSRGDEHGAAMHYRAAEKLYIGRLLEYEAWEPWFSSHARALQDRYLLLLERLADIAFEQKEYVHAQQYARRAQAIQPDLPGIVQLLERLSAVQRVQHSEKATSIDSIPTSAIEIPARQLQRA